MSICCKTIRSKYPYRVFRSPQHSKDNFFLLFYSNWEMHSRDICFLLVYSNWTLHITPIQLVSVLFIMVLSRAGQYLNFTITIYHGKYIMILLIITIFLSYFDRCSILQLPTQVTIH